MVPMRTDICKKNHWGQTGFSLVELVVVMIIIGILATQAIVTLTSPAAKTKGAAFNLRSDCNLARSESVNRRSEVGVDFIFNTDIDNDGDRDDGYVIYEETDYTNHSGYDPGDDPLIKMVPFADTVQFYNSDLSSDGGPNKTAGGDTPFDPGDGVSFSGNRFHMQTDGSSNKSGTLYLYVSNPVWTPSGGADDMMVSPYAVVIYTSGRVRLVRWRQDLGEWSTK